MGEAGMDRQDPKVENLNFVPRVHCASLLPAFESILRTKGLDQQAVQEAREANSPLQCLLERTRAAHFPGCPLTTSVIHSRTQVLTLQSTQAVTTEKAEPGSRGNTFLSV